MFFLFSSVEHIQNLVKETEHEWIGVLFRPKIVHERLRVLACSKKARMDERLLRITLFEGKDGLERYLFLVGQLSIGCGPLAGVVAGTIEAAQVMWHVVFLLEGMVFNFFEHPRTS